MKNIYKLEILKVEKSLTVEEQKNFRLKLKPLLSTNGIESLCLDAKGLFVEFNPTIFNMESFLQNLINADFPLKREIELV